MKKKTVSQEANVVGWICPICCEVKSPYEKNCSKPECKKTVAIMINSYVSGHKEAR